MDKNINRRGRIMRLKKLKLRGAIGIKKGMGLDEIEIDLTQFQSGLIALTGRNGCGKTTIMENLHPYRQMVSRDGSLQSHFFLKDSYRILEFEQNGKHYESKILIDALTGGSEAYLLCDSLPLNDGKLTTYDEAIEQVLGSAELFFNSVFSGQKSKGIAELKPADRRKLFYELLNLDIYEGYLKSAKEKLQASENKLSEIEGEIKAISNDLPAMEDLELSRVDALNQQAELISRISSIELEIENSNSFIRELEVKIKVDQEKLKGQDEIKSRLTVIEEELKKAGSECNNKIIRFNSEKEDTNKLIERNKKLAENKNVIAAKIGEKNLLKEVLAKQQSAKNDLLQQYSELQKSYSEKLKVLSSQEARYNTLKKNYDSLESELYNINKEIGRIEQQTGIINNVPCTEATGSSCQFLINAWSGKNKLPELNRKKQELYADLSSRKAGLDLSEEELNRDKNNLDNHYQSESRLISRHLEESEKQINDLNKEIAAFEKDKWEDLQEEAREAENNIALLNEKISALDNSAADAKEFFDKECRRLGDEAAELNKKLNKHLSETIKISEKNLFSARINHTSLTNSLTGARQCLETNKQSLAVIEQDIENLKKQQARIEELNAKKAEVENEIRDWTFLCRAFDKTGIPVLKLENSGVEITSVANELLSIFENKFRIVFETTSLTKDKKKLKETFDINIVEDDGVCEISNKSGGQQVWLETAIQLAISQVVRQQGRNVQTSFLDEKDGALDLDNAYSYIEMLKKAHELSGVYNTFIITHRTELLDFIPQQIKLRDGVLQIIN
jgi:exonuclease SbcC